MSTTFSNTSIQSSKLLIDTISTTVGATIGLAAASFIIALPIASTSWALASLGMFLNTSNFTTMGLACFGGILGFNATLEANTGKNSDINLWSSAFELFTKITSFFNSLSSYIFESEKTEIKAESESNLDLNMIVNPFLHILGKLSRALNRSIAGSTALVISSVQALLPYLLTSASLTYGAFTLFHSPIATAAIFLISTASYIYSVASSEVSLLENAINTYADVYNSLMLFEDCSSNNNDNEQANKNDEQAKARKFCK